MAKKSESVFLVMCDGRRVAQAPTKKEADNLAAALQQQHPLYPMEFSIQEKKAGKPHITKS